MSQPRPPPLPDALSRALGAVVRQRRAELTLSHKRIAAGAGLHRTYIVDVERGTRNIALRNVARLAAVLDLTMADLFTRVVRLPRPRKPRAGVRARRRSARARSATGWGGSGRAPSGARSVLVWQ